MTLFTFRGVKSHEWTFYDPVKIDGLQKVRLQGEGIKDCASGTG